MMNFMTMITRMRMINRDIPMNPVSHEVLRLELPHMGYRVNGTDDMD